MLAWRPDFGLAQLQEPEQLVTLAELNLTEGWLGEERFLHACPEVQNRQRFARDGAVGCGEAAGKLLSKALQSFASDPRPGPEFDAFMVAVPEGSCSLPSLWRTARVGGGPSQRS